MIRPYWVPIAAVIVALAGAVYLSANAGVETDQAAETKTDTGAKTGTDQRSEKKMGSIYDFKAKALSGEEIKFDKYKDHVLLIVNTASECGYTPQYQGLEELHKKFSGKGLDVLGFPCNQFGGQEPGDSHQIASFCQKNYGVDFQIFDKVDVNGPAAHPVWKYLTGDDAIKWNFTKFLINKKGEVVQRYESKVKPEEIEADIEKLL
jgi:glutathione peroxidase